MQKKELNLLMLIVLFVMYKLLILLVENVFLFVCIQVAF